MDAASHNTLKKGTAMKRMRNLMLALGVLFAFPIGMAIAGGNELAYFKIQQLTTLAPASIASGDYIAVYDASADKVKKVDATGLGGAFGTSTALVALNVSTTITQALHDGKILVLGGAGSARTMTLPAATGTGMKLRFIVGAVNTSNYVITHAGSDVFKGGLLFRGDNASNGVTGFESTAGVTITLNGGTTGGAAVGDEVILTDIASGVWALTGAVTEAGSEATPFS